jgi:hypothetical protein
MSKNNRKLICLTFVLLTCKFEKHKQSFLSENYEQAFPNKKHKQCNAHEKHEQSFPSENCNRTFLLSFAGSWLKLFSRIIKNIYIFFSLLKAQISR